MRDAGVDARQCYIEYDGRSWMLHQESRSQPTFVNKKPATHTELRHRSRVTFSDGSGFELISESDLEKQRKFRRSLLLLLGLGAVAGLLAVVLLQFL